MKYDLLELLQNIGMQKYVEVLQSHEIDVETLACMNEADLKEIGITTFGARKKLLNLGIELRGMFNQ